MSRKSYRKHKRGGKPTFVSETSMGNPNLSYAAPSKGGRRHRKRSMRGGSPYSSAASYGSYVNGGENSQYDRTFSQAGPYGNINNGNLLIGREGQWSQSTGTPNAASLALIQRAGSRHKRHRKGGRHTKKRRGGFLGQVINQAIVPFGILGMQQSYRRKHHHGKSKSHRRYK